MWDKFSKSDQAKVKAFFNKEEIDINEADVSSMASIYCKYYEIENAVADAKKLRHKVMLKIHPDTSENQQGNHLCQAFNTIVTKPQAFNPSIKSMEESAEYFFKGKLEHKAIVLKKKEQQLTTSGSSLIDLKLFFILNFIVEEYFDDLMDSNDYLYLNDEKALQLILETFDIKKDSQNAKSIDQIFHLRKILGLRDLESMKAREFSDQRYEQLSGIKFNTIGNGLATFIDDKNKSLKALFSKTKMNNGSFTGITQEELDDFNAKNNELNGEYLRQTLADSAEKDQNYRAGYKIFLNTMILLGGLIIVGGAILIARAAYTKLRYGESYLFGTNNAYLFYKHDKMVIEKADTVSKELRDQMAELHLDPEDGGRESISLTI